ncbi:ABC transporter permease [Feifania hominis]|uniref:ABC transporter permease n=1 Tax=Feifania hominis TaxID=2763660 RepID=A0A926DFR0_9FIRM|nr:ABC transporter permease [Feifania hominis]MBC8537026.1 ABC transporter permease [Feifania hominis]
MKKTDKLKNEHRGQLYFIMRRFRKNKLAMFGLCLFAALTLVAVFANFLASYDNDALSHNMAERNQPPGAGHLLGTDHYGRDLFARVIFGARISLFIGILTILISLSVGAIIGAVAGYYGGRVDNLLMRIMDVFMAIPSILLAISIVAALGNGMWNLLLALSISGVPRFARIVRSSILTVKGQEFVEAARAYGTTDTGIILRHILPNSIGPIIVQATLSMATTILTISSLSFVGLGLPSSVPEWGAMLSEAKQFMMYYPHEIIVPGVAIVLAVMALNLIGDGLRDAMDPKLKN